MSLISRVEVTNYLTEGINVHRRAVDWKPMLTGITLRMDGGKSALVNITNGGGKTSLVEILLYLLSRDARLHKRIREKVAPKSRGYTHARIEFRTPPEDNYTAPSLLEIDPLNMPGETNVVGVALNDDNNEQPIFYSYSGTLEDSPCYIYDGKSITAVADGEFVAKTKALRGCKWNRFPNRGDWEDHIRLFLPVEVVRRNVVYQLKGSDDKNASFFDFKPRGGESYDSAFFRAVVAPDLLSNLLSTFAEEGETAVEDTLVNSLKQIVTADKEIQAKEKRLEVRQKGIAGLEPILAAGQQARQILSERDLLLRRLRSDVAFLRYFGVQGTRYAVPGLPRSIPRFGEQDPRILVALKGMVIVPDAGILLLDKALSEMSGVEVRVISQAADRKQLTTFPAKSQVIDFACDFENLGSGSVKGGHYRRGYPKDSALKLPELLANMSGAKTAGLKEVLIQAFAIAEAQIDTNPASRRVRALEAEKLKLAEAARLSGEKTAALTEEVKGLKLQIQDRADNAGAWDDFVAIGRVLPIALRDDPKQADAWLRSRRKELQDQARTRDTRRGELNAVWRDYVNVLDLHGLEGLHGAQDRYGSLLERQDRIRAEAKRIGPALKEATRAASDLQRAVAPLADKRNAAKDSIGVFVRLMPGVERFASVFGDIDPAGIDPSRQADKAESAAQKAQAALRNATDERDELYRIKAQASSFAAIFGEGTDPNSYDPIKLHTDTADELSTVQQDLVTLLPQKEAIDQFQERFPEESPKAWLDRAQVSHKSLEADLERWQKQKSELAKEADAIQQMRSVEDGSFEAAWSLIDGSPLKVQRLHQTLMSQGMSLEDCNDAMSAMSGMLSAPVFGGIEDLQEAAGMLEVGGVSVPLILKADLCKALSEGVGRNGLIRRLGFIGGPTSRRVRILLDAEFARTELERVQAALLTCQTKIAETVVALALVAPDSDDYQLAMKAKAALAAGAGQRCVDQMAEARRLELALKPLKVQIQQQSLAVLAAAREFLKRGGQRRIDALEIEIPEKKSASESAVGLHAQAKERASHENLMARDDAIAYRKLGGEAAHREAETLYGRACEEVAVAEDQAEQAQATVQGLAEQQQKLVEDQQAYDQDGGDKVLGQYKGVLDFAANAEALLFMQHFEASSKEIADESEQLQQADRVNFVRAAAFKAHQGKSDQALHEEIRQKEVEAAELASSAAKALSESDRIAKAIVPSWQRLAKAIHELAYEIGSRVARSKDAAAQAEGLEEGAAVPEAHGSYKQAMAVVETLSDPALDSFGEVIERVEVLAQAIQEMNLHEDLKQHKDLESSLSTAQRKYQDLNTTFCEGEREASGQRDGAFNTLEIEEISRATPATIERLGILFEQLQASLAKERDDAQRAITIATQTAEDTLAQLAGLIQIATDNLATLNKVMARYPNGRFFFKTDITAKEGVRSILDELKGDVERAVRDQDGSSRGMRRGGDSQLKVMLREKLIECVFTNTEVEFVNGGIWSSKRSQVSDKLSTGQKIALEFMWIVRQAEYEIERGLQEMTRAQAAKSRAKANRVILIDGIFSTLSDRRIIKEALNGLRDLGGNFQIIGFLHSPNWNNDYEVFPVYHNGKKLMNREGDGLVSFREPGRELGTVGFFSTITQGLSTEAVS